jgi:hypothetical protein
MKPKYTTTTNLREERHHATFEGVKAHHDSAKVKVVLGVLFNHAVEDLVHEIDEIRTLRGKREEGDGDHHEHGVALGVDALLPFKLKL